MRLALVFLSGLTASLVPLSAQTASVSVPPPATLINQVVARDEATQQALHTMQYQQAIHTEQLDAQNHVVHREDLQLIVQPGAPEEFRVLSVKGDNIPSDPDQAIQAAKGQETERRKHDFSLKNLVARFNISVVGNDTIFGQKAYLLAFEPKPNQPYHDQTEKVLNQLHGQIWVRASDDVVLKTEATLIHPVSVAWIFAEVKALDFHYELRTSTNDFGPAWLQVAVEVSTPLIAFHQRSTVEMTHFEPRSSAGAL